MTDQTPQAPPNAPEVAPGWFPDPDGSGRSRWWSGRDWTNHFQNEGPEAPRTPRQKGPLNRWAIWSFVAAIAALVLAPVNAASDTPGLGIAIAIASVVFGGIGLRAVGTLGRGKALAMSGIVIGSLAALIFLIGLIFNLAQGGGSARLQMDDVEAEILSGTEEQTGYEIDRVECPENPTIREGESFECILIDPDGGRVLVEVRIQDNSGSYVWEVK